MNYVNPKMVRSPKNMVGNVRVIKDDGEDSWTLAEVEWGGLPCLAMRWNGSFQEDNHSIGTPQSRGVPLWFILPTEDSFIEEFNKAVEQVKENRKIEENDRSNK